MDDESSDLQLLLCDAGDGAPALDGGLSESTLGDARAPERGPRGKDSMMLEALHGDPNDLSAQRWAVVAPEGVDGDRRIEAELRELVGEARDGDMTRASDPRAAKLRAGAHVDDLQGLPGVAARRQLLRADLRRGSGHPHPVDALACVADQLVTGAVVVGLAGLALARERVVGRPRRALWDRPRAVAGGEAEGACEAEKDDEGTHGVTSARG